MSKSRSRQFSETQHGKDDLTDPVPARRELGEQYEDHVAAALV